MNYLNTLYRFRLYIRCMLMRALTTAILCFSLLLLGTAWQAPTDNKAISQYLDRLVNDFGYKADERAILISIAKQELYLVKLSKVEKCYSISSAIAGVGSAAGSGKTPLGVHRVSDKFGDGAAIGAIFRGRQNTGKIADIITEPLDVEEDDVTTRVIWLDGLEPGINKGGNVDSKSRYIYIHGTPEEGLIGKPASHGCIRMYNKDVVELFAMIKVGTKVLIY